MGGLFIFGDSGKKKRTAVLWTRSAMKGDDCGVYLQRPGFFISL